MAESLEVRLLGPLQVLRDGVPIEITATRQRGLLAALALSARRGLTVERAAAALWGEDLPAKPREALQSYVSRLRRQLGDDAIETGPQGYRLRLSEDQVDALRFVRTVASARAADDPGTERRLLYEALRSWRGEPLADIDLPLRDSERPQLEQAYLAAIERRLDLDLDDGELDRSIEELTGLVARYPLRESLWVRLLTALDRSGRRAEALEQYERIRTMIAEELGSDPGAELQAAYAGLLAEPPKPAVPPSADSDHGGGGQLAIPHQLPPDLRVFTGRGGEQQQLDRILAEPGGAALIAGPPGVGKTTLVVHWAHRVAGEFGDGVLYVDLRGYGPPGQVVDQAAALRGFIEALAPDGPMPTGTEELIHRFRKLTAGRRMLIILDNARDSDQVMGLLPATGECVVVVTSRTILTGFLARVGAQHIAVDPVDSDDAHRQLARRIGAERMATEGAAVDGLLEVCAGLPLAVAMVAARAASQQHLPLSALHDELRRTPDELGFFDGDVADADLRAVFSWSYRALEPQAAQGFRLLGLHPGPDLTAATAASLFGLSVARSRSILAELTRANLIREHRPGRYSMHDLLRSYAIERADAEPADNEAAIRRMVDHYVRVGREAADLIQPYRQSRRPNVPASEEATAEPGIANREDAVEWFRNEDAQLVSLIELTAARPALAAHADALLDAVSSYYEFAARWSDWRSCGELALRAATASGDLEAESRAHFAIAGGSLYLSDFATARQHFQQRRRIADLLGDLGLAALSEVQLGKLASTQGDHRTAIDHALRGLELARAADDDIGILHSLSDGAWYYAEAGEFDAALQMCDQVPPVAERAGVPPMAALTDTKGYILLQQGDPAQAIELFSEAIGEFESRSDRLSTALVLDHLGDAHRALGDTDAARAAWARAVELIPPSQEELAKTVLVKLDQDPDHPSEAP